MNTQNLTASNGLKVNHEEAEEMALYKRNNSNLARCYLDLRSSTSRLEEIARDNSDSAAMAKARLQSIKEIIDSVENRCMAADGPVTNTRREMTDDELKRIYRLAGGVTP